MKTPTTIVYNTQVIASSGRDGKVESNDGRLSIALSLPKEMGGEDNPSGTNPEQLFAAGYAACFLSAIKFVASSDNKTISEEASITSSVGIGPTEGGFALAVELNISLPGMNKDEAETLVSKAHQVCPYSNATRGNVEVKLSIA